MTGWSPSSHVWRAGGQPVLLAHPVRHRAAAFFAEALSASPSGEPRRSAAATTTSRKTASCTSAASSPIRSSTRRPANGLDCRGSDDGVLPRVLLSYDVSENVQLNAQTPRDSASAASTTRSTFRLCSRRTSLTFGGRRRSRARRSGTTNWAPRSDSPRAAASSTSRSSTRTSRTCRCRRCGHLLVAHRNQRAGSAFDRRRDGADRAADRSLRFRHLGELHGSSR